MIEKRNKYRYRVFFIELLEFRADIARKQLNDSRELQVSSSVDTGNAVSECHWTADEVGCSAGKTLGYFFLLKKTQLTAEIPDFLYLSEWEL